MQLRDLIRHGFDRPRPATLATVATGERRSPPTVASVATVAALREAVEPKEWPSLMGDRWPVPRRVLESLLAAGVTSEAMALGWDARELVGVSRIAPHDAPNRAGLIFSMREGETVRGLTVSHCVIVSGNVRHIWQRVPLTEAICLPWELDRDRI